MWALCSNLASAATVIYSDNFTHAAGALNGNTVQTSSGTDGGTLNATWTANTNFTYSGAGLLNSVGSASAYYYANLALTPVTGKVYTLTVDMDPANGASGSIFLAAGFASSNATSNTSFSGRNPWVAYATNGTGKAYSSGTTQYGTTFGTAGSVSNPIRLTLTLNTTTALWSTSYSVLDLTTSTILGTGSNTYTTNPTITSVYVGNVGIQPTNSTFDNFQLSVVPEPSAFALFGIGLLVLSWQARARRMRSGWVG